MISKGSKNKIKYPKIKKKNKKSRGINFLKLVEDKAAKHINFGCSRTKKKSVSTEIDQDFTKKNFNFG